VAVAEDDMTRQVSHIGTEGLCMASRSSVKVVPVKIYLLHVSERPIVYSYLKGACRTGQ